MSTPLLVLGMMPKVLDLCPELLKKGEILTDSMARRHDKVCRPK